MLLFIVNLKVHTHLQLESLNHRHFAQFLQRAAKLALMDMLWHIHHVCPSIHLSVTLLYSG